MDAKGVTAERNGYSDDESYRRQHRSQQHTEGRLMEDETTEDAEEQDTSFVEST